MVFYIRHFFWIWFFCEIRYSIQYLLTANVMLEWVTSPPYMCEGFLYVTDMRIALAQLRRWVYCTPLSSSTASKLSSMTKMTLPCTCSEMHFQALLSRCSSITLHPIFLFTKRSVSPAFSCNCSSVVTPCICRLQQCCCDRSSGQWL